MTAGEERLPDRQGDGQWPSWWRRVIADLKPARWAPGRDGLKAPRAGPGQWLAEGNPTDLALDLARRNREAAEARADRAEARGGRIAQTSLALLAITFTALGFSAARLRAVEPPGWVWPLALAPAVFAACCFCLAALQGIGSAQRVRLGQVPSLRAVMRAADEQQRLLLIREEVEAARVSDWSAANLLDEVLQARAWLTRGIIALMLAGAAVAVLW